MRMKQLLIVGKQLGKENWLGKYESQPGKGQTRNWGPPRAHVQLKILDTLSATSLKLLTGGYNQQSLHANFGTLVMS